MTRIKRGSNRSTRWIKKGSIMLSRLITINSSISIYCNHCKDCKMIINTIRVKCRNSWLECKFSLIRLCIISRNSWSTSLIKWILWEEIWTDHNRWSNIWKKKGQSKLRGESRLKCKWWKEKGTEKEKKEER